MKKLSLFGSSILVASLIGCGGDNTPTDGTGAGSGGGGTTSTAGKSGVGGSSAGSAPLAGSSTTGGMPSAGSPATGGMPSAGSPATGGTTSYPAPSATESIDNMEDGDQFIEPTDGRVGFWFSNNDGALAPANQDPPKGGAYVMSDLAPPRGTSTKAAKNAGTGFKTWGSTFGFEVQNTNTDNLPPGGVEGRAAYDASAWDGVRFFYKGSTGFTAQVATSVTDPLGGGCDPQSTVSTEKCWSHFRASVPTSANWVEVRLKFSELKQDTYGYQSPDGKVDPKQFLGLTFLIGADLAYEVFIDDVEFYKE